MSAILGILGNVLAGGATGILGSLFSNIFSYFQSKQLHKQKMEERAFALKERALIHDQIIEEGKLEIEKIDAEYDGQEKVQEAKAFVQAQSEIFKPVLPSNILDKMFSITGWASYITLPMAVILSTLLGFVDWLKHLMRPGLTIFVSVLYGIMIFRAYNILETTNYEWSQEQAALIITQFIDLTIYMVAMIWGWWFSDRRISKNFKKILEK